MPLQNYTLISYQTKVVCISYVIVDIKKHAKEMAGSRGGNQSWKRKTQKKRDRSGTRQTRKPKKGKEDLS